MGLSIGASGTQITLLNHYNQADRFTDLTTERLATGLRINRGSDDPAGLIAAEQLRGDLLDLGAQTRSLASERLQLSRQESGRQLATNLLHEIRGLTVEAADGTQSPEQREAIQLQIDSSLEAIDLLGAATGVALPASLEALRSGGSANVVDGDTAEGVELLEAELSNINRARVAAGAYEKYTLDVQQRLAEDQAVVAASALSQVEDADYASESSNLVTGQILSQAALQTLVLHQRIESDQILALFENLAV